MTCLLGSFLGSHCGPAVAFQVVSVVSLQRIFQENWVSILYRKLCSKAGPPAEGAAVWDRKVRTRCSCSIVHKLISEESKCDRLPPAASIWRPLGTWQHAVSSEAQQIRDVLRRTFCCYKFSSKANRVTLGHSPAAVLAAVVAALKPGDIP